MADSEEEENTSVVPGSESTNTPWSAHDDEEGNTYYYNSVTGESVWERPEGFVAEEALPPGTPREEPSDDDSEGGDEDGGNGASEGKEEGNSWVAYKDASGAEYYYNTQTEVTQWEKPEGFVPAAAEYDDDDDEEEEGGEKSVDETEEGEETNERMEGGEGKKGSIDDHDGMHASDDTVASARGGASANDTTGEERNGNEGSTTEEGPAARLREAHAAVEQPDSLFEPNFLSHMETVVEQTGDQGGLEFIKTLISSYRGHPAICGTLAGWLIELAGGGGGEEEESRAEADAIRSLSEDVIVKLAKERFTAGAGDRILDGSRTRRAIRFLEDMIDQECWRKLLIDLSVAHRDSALLIGCIKKISQKGHNREIANRIGQSDHFGVFNAMLASEVALIGKIAAGRIKKENDNKDNDDDNCDNKKQDDDVMELVANLKRICTSTAYTYFYAMEFLQDLISRAQQQQKQLPTPDIEMERALRMWERLREDLEEELILPRDRGATTTHVVKRRRVETATTLSDLYLGQRQRKRPRGVSDGGTTSSEWVEQKLDTALIELLNKHSLGVAIDESLADRLLVPHNLLRGQKRSIGDLLIAHPSAVSTLYDALYRPSTSSATKSHKSLPSMSLVLKQKCAKLLAKAILATRKSYGLPLSNADQDEDSMEMELWKMLLESSRLCKEVESAVSFTVSDYDEIPLFPLEKMPSTLSTGRRMCYLAVSSAPVARGMLLWIREMSGAPGFAANAAYPTLAPSLMGLARIIGRHHPATRPKVLDLAALFLTHTPRELSYDKLRTLQNQVLRLLLWSAVWGRGPQVFDLLRTTMEAGRWTDASAVRYFMVSALEVMRPPFSVPMVTAVSGLLAQSACRDAVRSPHFPSEKREMLKQFLQLFAETLEKERSKGDASCATVRESDVTSVRSLQEVYL